MSKETHYDVLGVSRTATAEEIKRAYRTLAREYHPDVNKGDQAEEQFKRINEAYGTLSDSLKRADYDQQIADPGVRGGGVAGAGAARPGASPAEAAAAQGPYRQALIRAAFARTVAWGSIAALVGGLLALSLEYLTATRIDPSAGILGAIPGLVVGLLWGADYNFKVETSLVPGGSAGAIRWPGRS